MAGRPLLLSFDVDCGELVSGHRFIARGLSRAGRLSSPDINEPGGDEPVAGFGFEYELVPGVPADQSENFFAYLVQIWYDADVELPWEPNDGGAIAPFEGGPSTHGSRGDWPLPAGARRLTFTMFGVEPGAMFPSERAAGDLLVDLVAGSAEWRPTSSAGKRHLPG